MLAPETAVSSRGVRKETRSAVLTLKGFVNSSVVYLFFLGLLCSLKKKNQNSDHNRTKHECLDFIK